MQIQSSMAVKVDNLTVIHGSRNDRLIAIEGISLEIREGETVAIIGPSGCGKSTLIRSILGAKLEHTGTVSFNGTSSKALKEGAKFGVAYQEPTLLASLTVRENILLPTKLGSSARRKELDHSVYEELLALVNLEEFEHFFPHQLSGGMQQRVSIARAMILRPQILLLDEPFASLDVLTRAELIVDLRSLLLRFTPATLLVTHSIEEAAILGSRIFMMSNSPGTFLEEIEVPNWGSVSLATFDDPAFQGFVGHWRSQAINRWNRENS